MSSECKQDNASRNTQVYLLFAREVGPLIKQKYPSVQKIQFNQILGRIWNELPVAEKNKYYVKAESQNQKSLAGPVQLQVVEPRMIDIKPLQPVGGTAPPAPALLRKLKPIRKFPTVADKDKYPTFQSYYKEIRHSLKLKYPELDEKDLVKKGFVLFKEMHKSEVNGGGFEMFSIETTQHLIKKYPNLTLDEIRQLVTKMWQNLTNAQKMKYGVTVVATEAEGEVTQNILMREDDDTETEGKESEPAVKAEKEEQGTFVDVKDKSEVKVEESESDPLFIKSESELREDSGDQGVPEATGRLPMSSTAEEEDVDDPGEVGQDGLKTISEVYCYCRTSITDNLIGCVNCKEFYHAECLKLSASELTHALSQASWKCPECQEPQTPPGPSLPSKNKVPPVSTQRFVKYQKVEKKMRKIEVKEGGEERAVSAKCTTCKILCEEVKRRTEIIEKMNMRIQELEGLKDLSGLVENTTGL